MSVRCFLVTMAVANCINCNFAQNSIENRLLAEMSRMQQNLDRLVADMRSNMESMQTQINVERQVINRRVSRTRHFRTETSSQNVPITSNKNIQDTRTLRNGGRTFTTSNGGRGYVYNSPDGSVNIFSYDSGPQYSGSIYQSGPDGTYFRQW